MPTATIVHAWQDAQAAHIAIAVDEPGQGLTEYLAAVPLAELTGKTTAQTRTILVAAARAVRDNDPIILARSRQSLAITGTAPL